MWCNSVRASTGYYRKLCNTENEKTKEMICRHLKKRSVKRESFSVGYIPEIHNTQTHKTIQNKNRISRMRESETNKHQNGK